MNNDTPISNAYCESNYWQSGEPSGSLLKTILPVVGALAYGYMIVCIAVLTILGPVAAIIWTAFLGYDVETLNGILAALVFGGFVFMLIGAAIIGIWNLLKS